LLTTSLTLLAEAISQAKRQRIKLRQRIKPKTKLMQSLKWQTRLQPRQTQQEYLPKIVISAVMHVKFMHKLCCLFSHIPTYLHVMRCYNHDLFIYGDFPSIPPFFVYNSAEQETPVFCIFKIEGPSGTQMNLGLFWHYYISLRINK
jgi:hypothetical protein